MASILFVCLGNICRSPAAEGVMRHKAQKDPALLGLSVASCGLGDWHIGQLPDERMRDAAQIRGYILSSRAQQFQESFLDQFDLILVSDSTILNNLYRFAKSPEQKAKMHLITSFSSSYHGQDIPDPYYQGDGGFQLVLDMIEDSCEGLIEHLKTSY